MVIIDRNWLMTASIFEPAVLMHGVLCIAFCLPVCPLSACASYQKKINVDQGQTSYGSHIKSVCLLVAILDIDYIAKLALICQSQVASFSLSLKRGGKFYISVLHMQSQSVVI